jgi:hypothetical protein
MPGQWSNFMKNFGKVFNYVVDSPIVEAGRRVIPGVTTAYDVFNNFNKMDDPNNTPKDIAVDAAKAAVAPIALIPGIGTAINYGANAVIDAASYLTDVVEGKKDAPPMPADVNARTNPVGVGVNKAVNGIGNFFRRFGGF